LKTKNKIDLLNLLKDNYKKKSINTIFKDKIVASLSLKVEKHIYLSLFPLKIVLMSLVEDKKLK
jgi:hypothetical protein